MNTSAAVQLETAEAVDGLLRELLDADPRLLSDEQQLQMARLNDKLTARLHALSTRTLAGIDKGQVTKHLHGVSTASWLREGRGYSGAQASGVVRGHEKVSIGGPVEVPAGGQMEVPTLCVVS